MECLATMQLYALPMLRVLVVDDSKDYLDAVTRLLTTFPCISKIEQALSGGEALEHVMNNRPDLMLVDVAMKGMNGLDFARTIKAMPNPPKIIIVTLYDTPTYREAAMAAGADGFLGKSELGDRLRGKIKEMFPGMCP